MGQRAVEGGGETVRMGRWVVLDIGGGAGLFFDCLPDLMVLSGFSSW